MSADPAERAEAHPQAPDEVASGEEGLGQQAAAGVAWLAAQKWVVRASGFVTLLVLTRILSPREFGVVAAAMAVIPFVYLLADLGFSTYLLQARDSDQRSLSTALWASVGAGVLLSAGLFVAAPLLARAFAVPELTPVLRALVLAVVPTVLAAVPLALLRRAMAFRTVALQGLGAALLAQAVAVAVAVLGGGVWALVAQVVVGQWVIAVLAWRRAGWRPSLVVSLSKLRSMASFGLRVSTVDVVATARLAAEGWIVTVALGPAAFGLLTVAQRLVLTAQELTAASAVPVSTVVFARLRESPDWLRNAHRKALNVGYAVVAPLMCAIVVTAPALVPMLFGEKWADAAAPAQALAIAGILTLGAMVDHGLFYGLGRPGAWLAYAVVVDAVTVATTAVAVRGGLMEVAVGFVGVALLATVTRWLLVGRLLNVEASAVAQPFGRVLGPVVGAVVAGSVILWALGPDTPAAVQVLAGGSVVAVVYVVLLRLLAAGPLRDTVGVVPVPDRFKTPVRRALLLPSSDPGSAP
ncbi:oligosaccharide flippase family protein [Knoellia sp. CPCC 206450]|uniref:oligosaccharide flippase family protein n=1 Tax=Knoellia tibetensis TaxID=3404798 RepID=UPI003B4339C7